jgi:hypothetical protein
MTFQQERFPRQLRELAIAAIHVASTTPGVVGLTAGGSAVHGGMDRWSDLDLVVICEDGAQPHLLREATAFAGQIGPLLSAFTGEHVGEPRLLICLFGPDPVHVDLKFVALGDAGNRIEDGLILWEQAGAVSAVHAATDASWRDTDVQWIEDRFWTWIHYGAVKIGRGELFDAVGMCSFLRDVVFGPLIARAHGRKPNAVRRIEEYAPEMVPSLAATIPTYDAQSCLAALRASVELYDRLTADIEDLRRHDAAREAVSRFVDAVDAGLRPVRG